MPPALQFLVLTLASWLNRHQADLIDYLREENQVLREQLGGRSLRLTDAQQRRLAVRGHKRRATRLVAGGRYRHTGHDPPLVSAPDRQEV